MSTYKEFLQNNGEKHWQDQWEKWQINKAVDFDKKPKKYVLDMFPYPSAAGLHVGHPEGYTATDIYSRYFRMKGFNVLHPMGWDAFGLPAENYAIKTGTQPKTITEKNIETFKRQIMSLGFSYDWSREINTTDPKYYKWTQWIFLQLFKKGLAYEATVPINWCPSCKTGLANEEVKDGKCDRCGTVVEKKDMRQWMLRITAYADRLLSGLENLNWSESIKALQRNWIGRSEGAEVDFRIANLPAGRQGSTKKIRVYTTRPDTLFGATYMVLSPEHPLVEELKDQIKNWSEVEKYITKAKNKSDLERTDLAKDKSGVELKGVKAINPVNQEQIPVWISDYVLASYGTGAIMAVPAHDERDFEFAKKFDLPIIQVVAPFFSSQVAPACPRSDKETVRRQSVGCFLKHWSEDKYLCLEWKDFGWHSGIIGGVESGENAIEAGLREIQEETGYQNVKFIKQITGETHSYFYAAHKNINRYACGPVLLFQLVDDNWREPELEHVKNHRAVWVDGDKMGEFINLPSFIYGWQALKSGQDCFTDIDSGVMINSEFLNDLKPSEAIGKMADWLEEKGYGKKAVNYKLRDWVFSRQRYWGEPIPLIYCEHCKKQKQKVLIIHGWEGSGEDNWLPWMKQELEKDNFEVFTPTMSTSASPKVDKWMEELMPYMEKLGENDIIIGHSLGSNAAIRLIEKANKKIGHLFLIGSAIGKLPEKRWKLFQLGIMLGADIKSLREFWEKEPLNWSKADELVANKHVILSDDDPYIHPDTHKDVPQNWNFELWHGHKHFTAFEAPEILQKVLVCKPTGWIPVPENELPLELPEVDKYEPTGTGESPLVNIKDWIVTKCPVCGGEARREANTMPQWAGSSWYWLRFIDPQNDKTFADFEKLKYWMPVDVYVGGAEHAVLHLLYGRFWNMVLYDLGYVPQEEPFTKLVNQGMILAENSEKMSKSRGNVVNPDDVIAEHGADAFRMYEMFMGPLEDVKPWNTKGIVGICRFLERVWNMVSSPLQGEVPVGRRGIELKQDLPHPNPPLIKGRGQDALEIILNKTIKKVGEDVENMRFNTAISAMMVLINESKGVSKEFLEKFLLILSPFAPHMTEELWTKLGHKESIFKESWPKYDESKIKDEEVELVVQINGKIRAKLKLPTGTTEAEAIATAKNDENVKKYLDGVEIKKTIFVQNKLISFVI